VVDSRQAAVSRTRATRSPRRITFMASTMLAACGGPVR
jgi:hypothetical protein